MDTPSDNIHFRDEIIASINNGPNDKHRHIISVVCYKDQIEEIEKVLKEIADQFNYDFEWLSTKGLFKRAAFNLK